MSIRAESVHSGPRDKDTMTVRLIFLVCFVPSLIHAATRRVLRGRATDKSVISEARAAAYTCVSFAFMG